MKSYTERIIVDNLIPETCTVRFKINKAKATKLRAFAKGRCTQAALIEKLIDSLPEPA